MHPTLLPEVVECTYLEKGKRPGTKRKCRLSKRPIISPSQAATYNLDHPDYMTMELVPPLLAKGGYVV